ncbi:hypothetical protein H9Q74_013753 [Fusarium xylarioides]|nr:hypothetical protein H9Q71_013820 [Fusarium xylarioides]KAG5811028.1 hypothetical protein H9Q74_013753 [Fusarium xylarioides]
MEASLPYHEPSITVIAILSSFLLLLSLVNYGLDKIAYCGLIGQIALGIAWGTPGAKWLSRKVEDAIVQLGYLGLVLLVFEGGLSTSFRSLKANLGLSSIVATTGIVLPIGLSFAVMPMLNATPLQAFAAGAALCSTSLGTTFTILGTSGLSATRLGVVLTSAAMMDDVIPALCRFIVLPLTVRLNFFRKANPTSRISKIFAMSQTAFVIHTGYLLGIVIGATFAGTSSLLASYIAGATISWWDSDAPHLEAQEISNNATEATGEGVVTEEVVNQDPTPESSVLPMVTEGGSGADIFHHYYEPALQHILKPFFFVSSPTISLFQLVHFNQSDLDEASIGFSVPITKLFTGPIVWRGVIYTILMIFAKLACGLWLMSFTNPFRALVQLSHKLTPKLRKSSKGLVPGAQCADNPSPRDRASTVQEEGERDAIPLEPVTDTDTSQASPQVRNSTPKPEKALSLYPACIVGIGMVARGEIGYLISALAESKGIFGATADGQSSEIFLIVTWAITLCTIIGPISVGLIVNRVRKLENGSLKEKGEGKKNVLGAWGVS